LPADLLPEVLLFADGCSLGNPGPGGIGVILKSGNKSKKISKGYTQATNNQMELQAIITGLEALKTKCKVKVYTDSKYVANAFNQGWLEKWQRNGWKTASKKDVKNQELWQKLLELTSRHEVEFSWIKGHNNHLENELCDQLAKEAARLKKTQPLSPK